MTRDEIESAISEGIKRGVADALCALGIDADDAKELRADFAHLRRWRRSVEEAESLTFKAIITVLATGLIGAIWLGVKASLGK